MPRSFSRYEQFLRIFALLDILSSAHQPLDDQSLIGLLKDRLGLARLSPRTLRRDCDFLTACGYAVDHMPLPDGRRLGWRLAKDAVNGRPIPAEPLTLLELVAVTVGRDLLKPFEGTVLWTGIESLCHKLERHAPGGLCDQLNFSREVIHVRGFDARYGPQPRLMSTLAAAITDCCEIEVEMADRHPRPRRLHPYFILIDPAVISLLAFPVDCTATAQSVRIDIQNIRSVKQLDSRFSRRAVTLDEMLT